MGTLKYDEDAIAEMCSQIDLLDYANMTMDFEKRGSDSYSTHCPLHIDKTPSLFITPSKNLFHCFSCGVGGTIINWLMTFEGLTFDEAIKRISEITGTDITKLKRSNAMQYYKKLQKAMQLTKNDHNPEAVRVAIDPLELDRFSKDIPKDWENEGIKPEVMEIFNIRYDSRSNRIVYPVYATDIDELKNGRNCTLIGFKGRTLYKNYEELGIKKYMNFKPIGITSFFGGMKEQFHRIDELKKVVIFEGLKSVMKAYGWGYDYSLSAETSYLNESQVKILIQLGIKDVTIAFDADVPMKKILDCTQLLRRFTNVFVIQDRKRKKDKLLGEKDAPVDKGKEVFEILLGERRKI